MRVLVACSLLACTTPATKPAGPRAPAADSPIKSALTSEPHAPVDVIVALSADPQHTTVLVPGPAQLALGEASLDAIEGASQLEVDVLEEQGNDAHVGVRLSNARFALWTSRARLLAALTRDVRIEGDFGAGTDSKEVVLLSGAQVRRLSHEGSRTKIRYVGALEVEGWVADDSLADRGTPGRRNNGRFPTGRRALMVTPGTVIRTEPKWTGTQLAVMSSSYFLDSVNQLDDGWYEVAYEDSDVRVHGFASTRDPPGRTHRRPSPQPQQTQYTPNATAPAHTCLYANDEPIGFLVGDQQALVERGTRDGWMTITIDTPAWGPIQFEAHGPNESTLETCGS
ncbi:MAG TPA: hypothetical protein VL326_33650 [Kofleriaceae bacterium]|nr:hypothetical protein [Kofleriaceae bacterium]